MTKGRKLVLLILLFLGVGIPLVAWLYRELQIDKCLDAGGRWEYQQRHCLFEEPVVR